jgi:ribosomal protein L15E
MADADMFSTLFPPAALVSAAETPRSRRRPHWRRDLGHLRLKRPTKDQAARHFDSCHRLIFAARAVYSIVENQ